MIKLLTSRSSCLRSTRSRLYSTTIESLSFLNELNVPPPHFKDMQYKDINEITSHLYDLGPYPFHSPYINAQHYYQNTVLKSWSERKPHPVTLRQLAAYGKELNEEKIITSANFVRLELPIRLSLILTQLQQLPFSVINNLHFAKVYESYYEIFNRFRKIPKIETIEDNEKFCLKIKDILTDINLLNLPHLMMGALECSILDSLPQKQLDELISSLLRARISRRLISEEHLSLTENFKNAPTQKRPKNFIGDIFLKCSAKDHLLISSKNAQSFIELVYPNVKLPKLIIKGDENLTFQFLTSHLHFLFGEILRNSYEATIKHFLSTNPKPTDEPSPMIVSIIDNKDHVAFRFSDRGGGVKIKPIEKIFSFGKDPNLAKESLAHFHHILPNFKDENAKDDISSTTPSSPIPFLKSKSSTINISPNSRQLRQLNPIQNTSITEIDDNFIKESTLINLIQRPAEYKLGLGLAMCKVYADYWNGDLVMHSLNGYGTDTFLKLKKLGNTCDEKQQLDRA